ncbi:MAG: adenylyl-sulfate kinase [Nevskiales bacterium]
MSEPVSKNIYAHQGKITRADRERVNSHRGLTLWFTGLSGSGKSTIAVALEEALFERGCRTYILDGDNVRFGLNKDLGFSPEHRVENIRRIGEVSKLFREAGVINLVAFISPYRSERDLARSLSTDGDFIEIYVDAALDVCEQRDPKGLYKKARAGQIPEFTGISAPYEAPLKPEIHLHTDKATVAENAQTILDYLRSKGYIAPAAR